MEQMAGVTNESGQQICRKGISGSTIKMIAIVTMLIDHIAAALLTRILSARGMGSVTDSSWMQENGSLYYAIVIMRTIGRLGFPLFCFLLVEGFQKTSNIRKYALRLALFSLISEIPFDLAFAGKAIYLGYQNVFFTLFLGLLLIWGISKMDVWKPKAWLQWCITVLGVIVPPCLFIYMMITLIQKTCMQDPIMKRVIVFAIILIVCLAIIAIVHAVRKGWDTLWQFPGKILLTFVMIAIADYLRTDYGSLGVFTILFIYLFRRRKMISMASGCIVLALGSFSEFPAFFALIPIAFYNGKRGWKLKYFFYAFYPVHLFLIWVIAELMGIGAIQVVR